jgi:DNA modification methylase
MPSLDWLGKRAVMDHHRQVPYHLLRCDEKLSVGDAGSGNLLVEGDNLLALKALLPYYAGQVKCIYIDPPYNTGNENWIYNDNVNAPEIKKWLGKVVGAESEDLSRHDKWLCMMYPRLCLLREMLHDDGSIWISMDDSEIGLLRLVMDEIFGRERFIACNVWQKRYSRENRSAIGDVHEYLLVYAKDPERFKQSRNRVSLSDGQAKIYKNPNNDPRGRWRAIPMTAQGYRPNQMYEIETPSGEKHKPPEGRCWSTIESEFKKLLAEGRIWFGKNGKSQPNVIRYLDEVDGFVPWTWWPHEEVGHTDESRKEIQDILGTQTAFDTPKPVRLLERVIHIASKPGDLILDSFSGSGTTGHAVLALNKADGGNRRFILVEMESKIACDVTAERVKRVIKGYGANAGLGGGFRYCRLAEPLFDETGQIRPEVKFADLAAHVWFTETGEPISSKPTGKTPFLGVHKETAYYLLFNGVLGDKSVNGGNVLTSRILDRLKAHDGPRIVYGEGCRLSAARLHREKIVFRQVPYEVKVS